MTEVEVLRSVWGADVDGRSGSAGVAGGQTGQALDDDCGPTKSCRNMKDVSFDGMAEPGSDLREAWKDRLRREGKLSTGGGSIRDLVLGAEGARVPGPSD